MERLFAVGPDLAFEIPGVCVCVYICCTSQTGALCSLIQHVCGAQYPLSEAVFGCEEVVYFESIGSSVLERGKLKPGTKKEIDDGGQNIFKGQKSDITFTLNTAYGNLCLAALARQPHLLLGSMQNCEPCVLEKFQFSAEDYKVLHCKYYNSITFWP